MYNSNRPNGKAELQWDFPNAWPPLQAFLVQGLDKTQNVEAQQLAKNLASNWLRTNYIGYAANAEKKPMYEKVSVKTCMKIIQQWYKTVFLVRRQ